MIRRLERWFRFAFFEMFGERYLDQYDLGHGNRREIPGWLFRGRFYPRDLD